ncbi:MAG: hypothetical protein ABR607_08040 [Pyrinomonadaceae bacterium]
MNSQHSFEIPKRPLILLAIVISFFFLGARIPLAEPARMLPEVDSDNDGLPDDFETANGLSPRHANLILVPVLRPGMTRGEVQPTLDKVIGFFARVTNHNPDGSNGIAVVIKWGNTLPATDRESESPCCTDSCTATHYSDVRTRGMPADLIGKGHGVLIGSCQNGGGETQVTDWSGASNEWHAIAHEVGHQLGLKHEPQGGIPSPLYASIMNYDYCYQFNGDPNAVHFSTGKFSSISLDENNLNETLPFSMADLQFLGSDPYRYQLERAGLRATNIDFNRNGVFGERGIRVEINGGSGLTARDRVDMNPTAGGFTLVALGDRLFGVYCDLPTTPTWGTYGDAGLSVRNPGLLRYQFTTGGQPSVARILVDRGVTGEPHGIETFGKLFLAFPTERGYAVHAYRVTPEGRLQLTGFALETNAPSSHPVLVRTTRPDELYLFNWNETTTRVSYRKVTALPPSNVITLGPVAELNMGISPATRLESTSPIGVAWNPRLERIALVSAARDGGSQGRMKLIHLGRIEGGWYGQNERWVGGTAGSPVHTLSRPTILFDDRAGSGTTGQYLIYNLWERSGSNSAVTKSVKLTLGGMTERWSEQLMMNIWTTSRSAPAAALYRDDIAWGWRVDEIRFPGSPNILQLFLRASGLTDSGITDFDDVTWISTHGLKESLRDAAR